MKRIEYDRLNTLQPTLQAKFYELKKAAWDNLQISIFLASATRTFDQQNQLYQQGRTTRGPRVTNAKPGQSWHNFGLAFDIAIWKGETLVWNIPNSLGAAGENCGLVWGGRWEGFRDICHFQLTQGLTLGAANTRWPGGWIKRA